MEVMTSDLFEIGYRTRPAKNILVDFEAFYSHSKNFSVLAPDSTNLVMPFGINIANMQPTPLAMPEVMAFMRYQNILLEANQMGLSASLDWIISEKLVAKAHFTYQQTKLDNYNPVTRDETIGGQAGEILGDGSSGLLFDEVLRMALSGQIPVFDPGNPDPNFVPAMVSATSSLKPTDFEDDYEHKASPSYWGSIGLDYKPTKQFNVFTNAYYYGKQTFLNQYDTSEVDAKILLNIKANYKVNPSLSLFVNARNVLNDDKKEFAFMDHIGGLYLVGLNFKL
jgi:iron complex outermembrane receptor protein